jgi:hypothetical protein
MYIRQVFVQPGLDSGLPLMDTIKVKSKVYDAACPTNFKYIFFTT